MSTFNWWMRACTLFLLWAATAVALPAQTFKTLRSFDDTDGWSLRAGLVQGINGNLYGTTYYGGADNYGTVFEISRRVAPEEVAEAAVWLASDAAAYVSAERFNFTGGMELA
jgi:uncharacterized repeat protein (TIGR03803 family)